MSNGFTIIVFQKCWDVIKGDLLREFLEFHDSEVINQSVNAIFVALLPKKSKTKNILEFRPISLITCLYGIIASLIRRI